MCLRLLSVGLVKAAVLWSTTDCSCCEPEPMRLERAVFKFYRGSDYPNELEQEIMTAHPACHSVSEALAVVPVADNPVNEMVRRLISPW